MRASVGNCFVELARILGAVRNDRPDLHVSGDRVQQFWQYRRVTNAAPRDLDGRDLQRFFIDTEVDLAPQSAFRTAILAGISLTFALGHEAGAVDEKVQRTVRAAIGHVYGKGFLASTQGAEVRNGPIQTDQVQEASNEACRLPERRAEQKLQSQTCSDYRVTVLRLSARLAGR